MARKPQVRYWSRKGGGFFTTIDGTQHELCLGEDDSRSNGPNYRKALEAYTALICQGADSDSMTLRGLYGLWSDHPHDPAGAQNRARSAWMLASLVTMHGGVRVADLLPRHVSEWWKGNPQWGATSRSHAGDALRAVINWGVREGHVRANPLAGRLTLPQKGKRGREARMSDPLMDTIEAAARRPQLRLFLRMLRLTGARPVELREATPERYHAGRIIHPWQTDGYEWKNARKTRTDRVIFVPDELLADVEALAAGPPGVSMFRTARGARWTGPNLWKQWSRVLASRSVTDHAREHRIDLAGLSPYCYRHTFISRWCDSGKSLHVCARLCGTSVKMVERVYGHPDLSVMHALYRDFLAGR